nr:hypothetical protein [Mycoplasmopsis bovis]
MKKKKLKKFLVIKQFIKETYETIVLGKKPVMLSDFTNEYLWSRDLVKIIDNGSYKKSKIS